MKQQQLFYNGKYKGYVIKLQVIINNSGMPMDIWGPFIGMNHDLKEEEEREREEEKDKDEEVSVDDYKGTSWISESDEEQRRALQEKQQISALMKTSRDLPIFTAEPSEEHAHQSCTFGEVRAGFKAMQMLLAGTLSDLIMSLSFPTAETAEAVGCVGCVGFDLEWTSGSDHPAAMQICTAAQCAVVRLVGVAALPPRLAAFLSDSRVLKVGVGIQGDARRLRGAAITRAVLALPLDKAQRLSDWPRGFWRLVFRSTAMSLSVTLGNFTLADTARPLGPDVRCLVQVSFGAMQATTPLCAPNETGVYAFPGFAISLDTTATPSVSVEVHVASGALVDSGELPVGRLSGTTATLRLRCAELSVSVERASGGSRAIEGQPGTSRALVVGINQYSESQLEGCVQDTKTVQTWLSRMGVSAVTTLIDGAASEEAIVRELRALVADAKPGDLRIFTFSGHGTYSLISGVKTAAICPADYFEHRDSAQLTSEAIAAILGPAARNGVTVVMHMDCCHSGTMGTTGLPVNGDNYRKPRFIPPLGDRDKSRDASSMLSFYDEVQRINNELSGGRTTRSLNPGDEDEPAAGNAAGAAEKAKPKRLRLFGSVMDSLRCGVDLGAAARAGMTVGPNEEGRFLNIVDGTSGIAPEVVEAATNTTVEGSRDIDSELSDEGAKALSVLSVKGWADAVVKALRADPNRMADIVNGVTGADATPQHRNLVAKDIADTALVRDLVARIAACNRSRDAAPAPMNTVLLGIARMRPDQQEAELRRRPLKECYQFLDAFLDAEQRGLKDMEAGAHQQANQAGTPNSEDKPLGPDVRCLVQVSFGAMQATTPLCAPNETGVYAFPGFAISLDTTATPSVSVEVHVASGALVDSGELPVGRLSGTTATLRLRCAELSVSVERASGGSRAIEGQPGTSRALVVGINQYSESQLEGCVQDTKTVQTWLSRMGVSAVTTLIDGAASEEAIVRELRALVADAKPGDLRIFTFSGHGTYSLISGVKTAAICPADYFEHRDSAQLTSEAIAAILGPAARNGVTVVMHMDCCHSGTMGTTGLPVNGDNYRKPRFIPPLGDRDKSRDASSMLSFYDEVQRINNELSGGRTTRSLNPGDEDEPAAGNAAGAAEKAKPKRLRLFGSVMDSLRCGVDLGAAARAGMTVGPNEEGRFLNIVDGTSGIAPEVVEAATNTTVEGSRDIDSELSDEGAKALSVLSVKGWADAVVKALRADPNRMADIVNGVTGADATPQHRNLVAKDIADTALVRDLVARIAACNRSRDAAPAPMNTVLLGIARMRPDQQEAELRRRPLKECYQFLDAFLDAEQRGLKDMEAGAHQQANQAGTPNSEDKYIAAAEVTKRGFFDVIQGIIKMAGPSAVNIASGIAGRGLKGEELTSAVDTSKNFATADALARVVDCHHKAPEPKPQWRMDLIKDVAKALRQPKPKYPLDQQRQLDLVELQALLDHPREVLAMSVDKMTDVRAAFIKSAQNGHLSGVIGDLSEGAAALESPGLLRAVREVSFRGLADLLGKVVDGKVLPLVQTLLSWENVPRANTEAKDKDAGSAPSQKMDREALLRHVCNVGLAQEIVNQHKIEQLKQLAMDCDVDTEDERFTIGNEELKARAVCNVLDKLEDKDVQAFLEKTFSVDTTKQSGAEAVHTIMARGWSDTLALIVKMAPDVIGPVVALRCPDWKTTSTREQAEAISEALYRVSNRMWRDILKDANIAVKDIQMGCTTWGLPVPKEEPVLPTAERGWKDCLNSLLKKVTDVGVALTPLIAKMLMRDIDGTVSSEILDAITREMAICPYRDFITAVEKQYPTTVLPILTKARGRGTDVVTDEAIDAVRRATEKEVMAIATRALRVSSASIVPFISEACKTALNSAAVKVFSEKKSRGIEVVSRDAEKTGAKGGGLVLMAACQIQQTASDALIDGQHQGAFTCFVNKALTENGFTQSKELTYSNILSAVSKSLKSNSYEQDPNFVPIRLLENRFFRPIEITTTTASRSVSMGIKSAKRSVEEPLARRNGQREEYMGVWQPTGSRGMPAETTPARAEEPEKGPSVLLQWDSAVSIRTVPISRRVGCGRLEDSQIAVVEKLKCTGDLEDLLRDTDLEDIDAMHTYTTVRNVIDAYERCLLPVLSRLESEAVKSIRMCPSAGKCEFKCCGCSEKQTCPYNKVQRLKNLVPFKWIPTKDGPTDEKSMITQPEKLQISTRTADFGQPYYSTPKRGAPALCFPVFDMAAGDGSNRKTRVSTCRSVETVAHTAGYAMLDALQPEWRLVAMHPWAAVVHEAFADLTALLAPLAHPCVCAAVVVQSRGDVSAGNLLGLSNLTLAETLGMSALRSAGSTLTLSKAFSAGRQDSRTVSSVLTSAYYGALASTFNDLHTTRAMDLGETLHVVAKHATTVLLGAVVQSRPCDSLRDLAARLVNEANPYPLRKPKQQQQEKEQKQQQHQKRDWFINGLRQHFYEALVSLMRLKELLPPLVCEHPRQQPGEGQEHESSCCCEPLPSRGASLGKNFGEQCGDIADCIARYNTSLTPELLKHTSPTIIKFYASDHPMQTQIQCKRAVLVVTPNRDWVPPKIAYGVFSQLPWVFDPSAVYRCVADMVHTGLPGLKCPISYEIWLAWSKIAGATIVELRQPPQQLQSIVRQKNRCETTWTTFMSNTIDMIKLYIEDGNSSRWFEDSGAWRHVSVLGPWNTYAAQSFNAFAGSVAAIVARGRSPAIHLWRHLRSSIRYPAQTLY
eukprot:m51a1_g10092 hypothetical protein (2730) ;mRNA; r:4621-30254